jgi:hypothetical protein
MLTKSLDLQYKKCYEDTGNLKKQLKKKENENKMLKRELALKTQTLETYQYLLSLSSDDAQEKMGTIAKCNQCPKFFETREHLRKHYSKSHPMSDFMKDCPDVPRPRTAQAVAPKISMAEESPIVDYEEMFSHFQREMQKTLSGNMQKLESDIMDIRSRQTDLSTMDSRWGQSQKELAQSMRVPGKMIDELKSEMDQLIAT